jgi:hypothetical protein
MAIFLDSPRYALGVFGFLTTPAVERRVYQIGGIATLLILLLASGIYLAGPHEASVPGQMLFLSVAAWLGIFGFFRLFATGAMWVFAAVASVIEDVVPSFARPLHFLLRAYWIFFELFLIVGFFWLLVAAGCIPLGVLSLKD